MEEALDLSFDRLLMMMMMMSLKLPVKQTVQVSGNVHRNFTLCLPDCWREGCMHPEGPATGHLDTAENFLVDEHRRKLTRFPLCVQARAEMVPKVQSCYGVVLMQPFIFRFIKINSLASK